MALVKISIELPEELHRRTDVRRNLQNMAGRSGRRELGKIAQAAAAATDPYFPHIADAYRVTTQTGADTFTVDIVNDHPDWIFAEIDMPAPRTIPPAGEGSRIAEWSARVGANPYAIARHVHIHGTKGHYFLTEALDDGFAGVEENVFRVVERWHHRWGQES